MGERSARFLRHLRERTRRHFVTGLLVIVPLWLTWFVIASLVKRMDRVLAILPDQLRPETWLPFPVPGLGVILTLFTIQLAGILGANLLGRGFVRAFEGLLRRIPFVRGIYGSAQQVLRQIVVVESNRFKRVVLVRYPGGEGLYRLGFVTGERQIRGPDGRPTSMLHLFLPNSPNAATGHFFLASADLVLETAITTEEAFKLLMSAGLVEKDETIT
jgi:uncharacterized membrane protein